MSNLATPDYLTPAEVAEVMRCSSETVLRAIRRGDLPAMQYGRLRLVERSALQAFLAAKSQPRRRHLRGA